MMNELHAIRQFVAKLERRGELPRVDREALFALPAVERAYAANEIILAEDVAATHCAIVGKGFVSRMKQLGDSRQIVALHIPGDAVDLQSILFTKTDHRLMAHTLTEVCWIPHEAILRLTEDRPILARALWLDTLIDASIFREWTANIGQRSAQERIAHLLLEMRVRLGAIGAVSNDTYELPLTQNALADSLGLSLVHMNKSLQALRRAGHLTIQHRTVIIEDLPKLVALSGFDDAYLHTGQSRIKNLWIVEPESEVSIA